MFRVSGLFFRRIAHIGMVCLFALRAGQTMADGDTNTVVGSLGKNFAQIRKRFQTETNNVEAAWQFGRACYDMSTLQKDPSRQAEIAEQGIAACRAAIALKPGSAQAHYYLGMNIGQVADAKHSLSGLRLVKDVEREFLAAHTLDEHFDYGGPDRNLGLLYEGAPAIVSIGSRSKARQHLQKAVELAPEFPENQLNLIEAYLKWDYHAEAERQLGELEKIWPAAQKKFTGDAWVLSWTDWNKRFVSVKKKIGGNPKVIESPHSANQ
jgi:tetratricopeptide (TPR) repeat protein